MCNTINQVVQPGFICLALLIVPEFANDSFKLFLLNKDVVSCCDQVEHIGVREHPGDIGVAEQERSGRRNWCACDLVSNFAKSINRGGVGYFGQWPMLAERIDDC